MTKQQWNLDDIYPLDQFNEMKVRLQNQFGKFQLSWEKITPKSNTEDFVYLMENYEKVVSMVNQIVSRLDLGICTDQNNNSLRKLREIAEELISKIEVDTSELEKWLKGLSVQGKEKLDLENAQRFFCSIPQMEYSLKRKLYAAKYLLKPREENIIDSLNQKSLYALYDLRNQLINDYKFSLYDKKRISQSELMTFTYNKDHKYRTKAYKLLLSKYKKDINKHFLVYQSLIKCLSFESKLRGFENPFTAQNFNDDISDTALKSLFDVIQLNKETFGFFFKYQANLLKIPKFSRFDTHALTSKADIEISFDQAKDLILNALQDFNPKFFSYAKLLFDSNHIDYFPNPKKQIGAFCETISPSVTPYIFVNYYNRLSDVFELAHEIGHAIHSMFSSHLPPSTQESSILLSETASTLTEMVVFDYYLKQVDDPKLKKTIILQKLTDSYSMIFRKSYLVLFELKAFELVAEGSDPESLSQLYFDILKEQYGDNVEIDQLFRYEWACIKHLYDAPFYGYSYCFGELLSYSLYSNCKKNKQDYLPKIENILSAGGSVNTEQTLSMVGIDINSKETWISGFSLIQDLINQLN